MLVWHGWPESTKSNWSFLTYHHAQPAWGRNGAVRATDKLVQRCGMPITQIVFHEQRARKSGTHTLGSAPTKAHVATRMLIFSSNLLEVLNQKHHELWGARKSRDNGPSVHDPLHHGDKPHKAW